MCVKGNGGARFSMAVSLPGYIRPPQKTVKYGHLGYNPDIAPPDPNNPVQNQYTGTWDMYRPPNDDPRIAKMLANYVLNILTEYTE